MEKDKKEKLLKISISQKFKEVIEKQKKRVQEVTYSCVKVSDREACDMIAEKILSGVKVL